MAGLVVSSFVVTAAAADRQTITIGANAPDAKVISDFLFPEAQCENVKYQCLAVRPSMERSVGMEVRFPTNSAELTPAARAQLEPLGKALASRNGKLSPGEIVIEGHTDARGTSELNKKLSEQRAKSVVQHLVSAHNVDAKALQALGRGKDQLKEGTRPDSEANRRVELVRKPN
jgi:outer membrane protein OmpA-like peptidoglycan-associated protein